MEGWKPIDHGAFIGETRLFSCLFLIKENADAKIQQDIQNCKVFPFIKITIRIFWRKSHAWKPSPYWNLIGPLHIIVY